VAGCLSDKMSKWSVQKFPLSPPPLQELVPCITAGLQGNFQEVSVEVTACPDLRQKPFGLAAAGLSGNARVADIGGPPNLAPTPKLDRKYSLLEMARLMEMSEQTGFMLGAGAGPFHVLGINSELMPNLSYEDGQVTNLTYYAKIDGRGGCVCERIASKDFGLMANLFGSDGSPGQVLKIVAKTRTGKMNFTETIQAALRAKYGERTVSVGGVFVIRKGKANLHVMPDFPQTPFKTREEVNEWLRYFDMPAPLVCLSVFHSHDPGLDLRMEHTHCFSDHNEGGHYHDDTTPEEVEYEAYLNVASAIYRIDRPGV
jgi:Domain of Unknown Function (DUF1907)